MHIPVETFEAGVADKLEGSPWEQIKGKLICVAVPEPNDSVRVWGCNKSGEIYVRKHRKSIIHLLNF